jgi:hypothetical protein
MSTHDTYRDHPGRLPVTQRLRKLQALEDYGVDNWEGYGDAMRSLGEPDEDDGLSD